MKTILFSCHPYEKPFIEKANREDIEMIISDNALTQNSAIMARDCEIVSAFVCDILNSDVLKTLHKQGTKMIALRSAGFNHVDMATANKLGIQVARVPAYSPHAVAEFAIALILTLNRKILRASQHIHEYNFSLKGLMGFDLNKKTVGIIGTGKIGEIFAKIMSSFGCNVIAYDIEENRNCLPYLNYTDLDTIYKKSDIISLHCPLTEDTQHIISDKSIPKMKDGVMLINTGRGGLMDSKALIKGLKTRKVGYLGMDVYEEEESLFFADHSEDIMADDTFARLLTFPNVIITGHQAYFTREAMQNIAATTIQNMMDYINGIKNANFIKPS